MHKEQCIVIVGDRPSEGVYCQISSFATSKSIRLIIAGPVAEVKPESLEDANCIIINSLTHSAHQILNRLNCHINPEFLIVVTASGKPEPRWDFNLPSGGDSLIEWTSEEALPAVFAQMVDLLLLPEVERLQDRLVRQFGLRQLVGHSPAFQEILKTLPQIARSPSPVLITGETGTGKEACARAIHYLSNRGSRAFIPINCGAIPDHLFENEFFGHKKGAFTDAHIDEPGILHQVGGGTLFLDEITSLPLLTQAKILRIFEEGSFRPLGGHANVDVKLRFIVATNLDIHKEVNDGRFRKDLLYRINVLRINLPSLRERGGDEIEELSKHFIDESAHRNGKSSPSISPDAIEKLRHYSWPGNVRELKNVIERAVVLSEANLIGPAAIDLERVDDRNITSATFREARRLAIEEFERNYLARALQTCGHNVTRLSTQLAADRRTVQRLLQKYHLSSGQGVRYSLSWVRGKMSSRQLIPP